MRLSVELKLTPLQLAEVFCEMSDEEQAQVFIEAARIAAGWPDPVAAVMQWYEIGKHLRDCDCSTDAARTMIKEIVDGINMPRLSPETA